MKSYTYADKMNSSTTGGRSMPLLVQFQTPNLNQSQLQPVMTHCLLLK
ncbi:hypothetical protein EMIT07CA2_40570 [Brevibacillus sp. IT-7CA2]